MEGTERGEREITLFKSHGVLVTTERLVAAGRTWLLGTVEGVEFIRRSPRVLSWPVPLIVGVVVGLPALLSARASSSAQGSGLYDAAVALAGLAIFGSIAALLLMGDTYWLVLRTRRGEHRVLRSQDQRFISNLANVVAKAAESARQRR